MSADYQCYEARFFINLLVVLLVLFMGLMPALTLGLMSLSIVDLKVLAKLRTPKDHKHAEKTGTTVVTRSDGRLALRRLGSLFEQAKDLNSQGYELILVSSSAVGVGL